MLAGCNKVAEPSSPASGQPLRNTRNCRCDKPNNTGLPAASCDRGASARIPNRTACHPEWDRLGPENLHPAPVLVRTCNADPRLTGVDPTVRGGAPRRCLRQQSLPDRDLATTQVVALVILHVFSRTHACNPVWMLLIPPDRPLQPDTECNLRVPASFGLDLRRRHRVAAVVRRTIRHVPDQRVRDGRIDARFDERPRCSTKPSAR